MNNQPVYIPDNCNKLHVYRGYLSSGLTFKFVFYMEKGESETTVSNPSIEEVKAIKAQLDTWTSSQLSSNAIEYTR